MLSFLHSGNFSTKLMGIRKAQTSHISYQACDSLKYLMEKSTLKAYTSTGI